MIEEQLASIQDRLEHLSEVVREAVEELGVIRDIEDEKAADLQWAVRNGQPVLHLSSMPLDPATPDWSQQLNRYSPADLPATDSSGGAADVASAGEPSPDPAGHSNRSPPPGRAEQASLWPQDENSS